MDHEESDEFSSEYVVPLRGEGSPEKKSKQRDFKIEPPRRSRFDEEDPVSSEAPRQPGKSSSAQAPSYPRRIPPLHEDEEQLSSLQRDSFSKSDSFSQSSRELLEKPSVSHESVAPNYGTSTDSLQESV